MKIKRFFIIFIMGILLLTLTGCGTNTEEELQTKNKEQLNYIDSKIIGMMNSLNNISIQNYKVVTKNIELKPDSASGTSSNGGQSSPAESSSSGSDQGEESQVQSGGESGGSSGSESSGGEQGGSSSQGKKVTVSEMTKKNILTQNKDTNWDNMKSEIESMYEIWNSIILDLYKLNIKNEDILSFSSNLDSATQAIKNEDKAKTMQELSNLYSHITRYLEYYSKDTAFNNIKYSKQHILAAYTALESDNWDTVNDEISKAEQTFLLVVNNLDFTKDKQYSVNRAYISLMELKNSLETKDKDIFYINYKSVIENINFL